MSRVRGPRVRVVRRRTGGVRIAAAELQLLVARALRACGAPATGEAIVTLVDDREMARLNAAQMAKEGPTDVLSFPLLEPTAYAPRAGVRRRAAHRAVPAAPAVGAVLPLGDIVISVDRAIAQAREGRGGIDGRTAGAPADELRLLAVHGALHLCGWDHRTPASRVAMFAEQAKILRAHARAVARGARSGARG